MATNSINTNAPEGIAIHPDLVGGGIDPEGLKVLLSERSKQGAPAYVMGVMSPNEADQALTRLDQLGAFRALADGGYGFVRRQSFFPRSEAVLARHLRAAQIGTYIGSTDQFTRHKSFPQGVVGLVMSAATSGSPSLRQWSSYTALMNTPILRERGVRAVTPVRLGGTPVYRVSTNEGSYLLKVFGANADPDREHQALAAMQAAGLPVLNKVWSGDGFGFYSDPGGECVRKPTRNDLAQFGKLWHKLDQSGAALKGQPAAADARLVLESYANAVTRNWGSVFSAAQAGHKQVMFFMMTDLEQLRQDCINHYYLWCKRQKWEKETVLDEKEQLFAPGPLILNNCLRSSGGLILIDNSGSGWDDPARVMADFFFDLEQDLPMRARLEVLDSFAKNRAWDTHFMNRFWAVADLIAVEWILKLLSVVLPAQRDQLQLTMSPAAYLAQVAQSHERAHYLREHFQSMEHICKHDQLLEDGMEIR